MKKHKTIDINEPNERFCDELNGASDVRILSLILHLYIEYYLNELIKLKFDEVPNENKDRIKELVYLDLEGNESDYDVPWGEHENDYFSQLHVCGTSTIIVLQQMI